MPKNLNLTHAHLRRDYVSEGLLESKMKSHPMQQFALWFGEAEKNKIADTNAFVLATANKKGRPSARVLLMKGFDLRGITFFTNYASAKGKQIAENPRGEAVFFWNQLNRQVRLSGRIVHVARKSSLAYFKSRPHGAQLAACVSHQSHLISNRIALKKKFLQFQTKLQGHAPALPADWGGYELRVQAVEFWQGMPNRLHDRVCYRMSTRKQWKKFRIQP